MNFYKFSEILILFLLMVAASISFGLSYGNSNHNTYLIEGLVKLNPNFIPGDWFAHQTQHYHDQFSRVIWIVDYLGVPLSIGLTVIGVILKIFALVAIYKIIGLISNKHKFISFLYVLFIIVLESTKSVAGSYIFSSILQPSSFGSVFTLIGFLYFLRGNYFISGVCIAFAGYMHTNFLLLGFVYLCISHLFLGREDLIKRFFSQFIPMIPILTMELPFLLGMISSENGELPTYIFQFIRSPHHYVPNHYLFDFFLFAGWSFIGIACLNVINLDQHLKKRIVGLYSALFFLVVIATLLTTIIFIPLVSKIFFWRLAPFSVLFSQILFVTVTIEYAFLTKDVTVNHLAIRLSLLSVGCIFIVKWYSSRYGLNSKEFSLLILLAISIFMLLFSKIYNQQLMLNKSSENAVKAYSIGIVLLVLLYSFEDESFNKKSTLINGFPGKAQSELYEWTKKSPKLAIYLIPPSLQNFRLHGERAVVVDWKSTPVDPDGLVEWYRRIGDITGIRNVRTREEANKGYLMLDKERLKYLKTTYDINFAVLYKGKNITFTDLPVCFENEKFSVIALEKL